MSGGKFDYKQFYIDYIAEEIEKAIARNTIKPDWVSDEEWDGQRYSDETIKEFEKAIAVLKRAATYAHHIDWLLSGDYSEDGFHKKIREELGE